MRKQQPRNSWWLLIGIIGISIIGWFVNTFPPKNLSIQIVFFFLLFITATSLSLYILNNVRRSLLTGFGFIIFLLLRFLGLREPLYVFGLIASLLSLELYFRKR